MLNTDSKFVGLLIWTVIAVLLVGFAWSFFAWPPASVMIGKLLDSEIAAFANRNQTILAGLVGIGGAAVAYLLNGWRDRAERRHAIERVQSRTANVLAKEAAEIGSACEAAARALTVRGLQPESVVADLRGRIVAEDSVLLSGSVADVASLGSGAATAVRAVRGAMRRLNLELDAANREDGVGGRIAGRALEASFAAGHAARVMEALARAGVTAADRVRPTHEAANADAIIGGEEVARSPRLQPAA